MIYFFIFAATSFLLYLSSKCKGALKGLLVVFALLLPCFLAGFRDETVGVDVLSYAKYMCADAQSLSFAKFLSAESSIAAAGWNVFTWVSVHLFGGLPGYLFAIELLCILPIYFAARRLVPDSEWLVILFWLLLEFGFTLNGMRQSVAMAFVFYSLVYVVESKPIRFVVCIVCGMLFHQTAFIGFLLYPFSKALAYGKGWKKLFGRASIFAVVFVVAALFAIVFALGPRLVVLASSFKNSYSYQVNHLGEEDISIAALYLLGVVLFIWFITKSIFAADVNSPNEVGVASSLSNHLNLYSVLIAISIVGCLLWQLNYVASTMGRFGYYGVMFISLLGGGPCRRKENARSRAVLGSSSRYLFCCNDFSVGQGRSVSLYLSYFRDWLSCLTGIQIKPSCPTIAYGACSPC